MGGWSVAVVGGWSVAVVGGCSVVGVTVQCCGCLSCSAGFVSNAEKNT